MTRRARAASWAVVAVAVAVSLWYLRDPPWAGAVTSGLRRWTLDARGTPYRWTNGHASFFVPADAGSVTLPVRSGIARPDGRAVIVSVSVDDRELVRRRLENDPERWTPITLAMPGGRAARRFRRVDVRLDQVIPDGNLGVQLGEPVLRWRDPGR